MATAAVLRSGDSAASERASWALSFDVPAPNGAPIVMRVGRRAVRIQANGRSVRVHSGALQSRAFVARFRNGRWIHVEMRGSDPVGSVALDAGPHRVRPVNQLATGLDAQSLLLHHLTDIHARTPAGRFPLGIGRDGRLRFGLGWTSGFWAGSLWQAADLTGNRLFRDWAREATDQHLGFEREDTHDLGFMYETSSLAAYQRLCPAAPARECARLRASALTAAESLVRLAATNHAAGTLPTRSRGCTACSSPAQADTIVDSIMNVPLLLWAASETHSRAFRDVASRHAHALVRLVERPDGSTFQSVHFDRASGRVIERHTHQGYSDASTWARGQAWSLHGFADVGRMLGDPGLVGVAERNAQYVEAHLPASGVPPYDYAAPAGAPADTSAGVITAAGLFRLAQACAALPGACNDASRWAPLGRRMLAASVAHVSEQPPLGLLGSQVYSLGGRTSWDDDAELIFGVYYALEALKLERRAPA